jgi:protein involved in polysaccharide export with SLBB domain
MAAIVALVTFPVENSGAQPAAGAPLQARFETRAQLELAVSSAEEEHRDAEAALLKTRLRVGDFQEGDRIVLAIEIQGSPGGLQFGGVDTTIVRSGKMLQFKKVPNIPDLSLEGVLRSELADTVTAYLSKYLRNPSVRATPLLRVAVVGAVGRPGWYLTPGDAVLSDVIMQAGGVTATSNIYDTVVRREGTTIINAKRVRSALADGCSLDRLNLRAGDEILVNSTHQWSVMNSIQLLGAVVGIYGVIITTRAIHK